MSKQEIEVSVHDFNKAAIQGFSPIEASALDKTLKEIADWMIKTNNEHYALFSFEKRDFTVFKVLGTSIKDTKAALKEVVVSRGPVQEIDSQETEAGVYAYELWINGAFYALFPYDNAIVTIK